MLEDHIGTCTPPAPQAPVFAGVGGGTLRVAAWRSRFWAPATWAPGLAPLRVHDMRHTAVALWIAAGPTQSSSLRAGHPSVAVVLDRYGHLFEGRSGTAWL